MWDCRTSSAPAEVKQALSSPKVPRLIIDVVVRKQQFTEQRQATEVLMAKKFVQFFEGHEMKNTLPETGSILPPENRARLLPQKEVFIGTNHQFFEGLPAC